MKKVAFILLFALVGITSASAQFEKGKKYVGATVSGFDMSYSETTKFHFGLDAKAGYMIARDWMILGQLGFNYHNSDVHEFSFGASGRYYIEQNGIFLSVGAKYVHEWKAFNDFVVTPEVGYCFFLNRKVTLEPSIYFDMSMTKFGDRSRFGLKVGIGFFF